MLIDSLRALFSGYPISLESILMQILATLFVIFCILPLHEYALAMLSPHTARRLSENITAWEVLSCSSHWLFSIRYHYISKKQNVNRKILSDFYDFFRFCLLL